MRLDNGMKQTEVAAVLRSGPYASLPISVGRQHATTEVYRLSSGQYYSDYFLSYDENDKLIFWGYPHEYTRRKNSYINSLGKKSLAALKVKLKQ